MHRRFEAFLAQAPEAFPEGEARAHLQDIVGLIAQTGQAIPEELAAVRILDRGAADWQEALGDADAMSRLYGGERHLPRTIEDLRQTAAGVFLSEPFYAAAGNYYELRDWVTGALVGDASDRLWSALYRLWLGGWQCFQDEAGLILLRRKV